MKNGNDKVTIKIPRAIYDKIKNIIADSSFDSATDFIVYVLRDIIAGDKGDEYSLSPKEIEVVKKRLKNLGYL